METLGGQIKVVINVSEQPHLLNIGYILSAVAKNGLLIDLIDCATGLRGVVSKGRPKNGTRP